MNAFEMVAALCLVGIVILLIAVPFIILRKLDEVIQKLKSIDDRAALQDYKSQRKETVEG